jgi:Alpha-L-arabinofuranosidase B, catalytic
MKFYKKIVFFFLIVATLEGYAQNTLDNLGLTNATPAAVAYSLRKLSSSYVGKAIQVRRSNDNTTQDIGFDINGNLDTTALLNFTGSNDGFVTIWYDQSGNGRNLIKADFNFQPKIVFNGTFKYIGTRIAIDFSGNKGLVYSGSLSLASITSVIRSESTNWPSYHTILGGSPRIGGILEYRGTTFHSNVYPLEIWRNGISKTTSESLAPVNEGMVLSISPRTYNVNQIFIGNYDGGSDGGSILESEAIAFTTLLGNNRLNVECNQGGYYNISIACNTMVYKQPATTDQNECKGKTAIPISVEASGLNLTYQWFSNTTNSNFGGTIINGATSSSYVPSTSTVGTSYYYVEISSSNDPTVVSTVSGPVIVNEMVSVVIYPTSSTINSGESVTLTASGASSYFWGFNNATPLDNVSNYKLAVGLRLLRSAYSGAAIRLRRSVDNAEADFGFSGTDLNTVAINTWLNGSVGYCVKLYDQSGNGNDMTTSSFGAQPLYVVDGLNNKPILRFNTSQNIKNNVNFSPPYTVIYGAKQTGPSRGRVLDANNNWLLGWWNGNKGQAHFDGWVSQAGGTAADNNPYVYTGIGTGSVSAFYENGISKTIYPSGGLTGPNGLRINERESSDVDVAEIFAFNSVLSANDRLAVEKSTASYYGIYGDEPLGNSAAIIVSPTETTSYSVTGYSPNGICDDSENVTVTVLKNPNLTNFNSQIKKYFDGSYTISPPSSSSTGAITYASSNTAVATIIGTTVTIVGAGSTTIAASQAANSTHYGDSISATLTVNAVSVLTKNGQVSTTDLKYINKYGAVGGDFGVNKNGLSVQTKSFDLLTGLVMNLDAGNLASYPGTGTTWTDLSGLGNNGILVNNPVYNSSNGGNLVFNGSNTYVDAPLTKTASCTFSVWTKSTSASNMLFNAGNDGSGPDLFFYGGVLSWNTWDSSNNPFGNIPATAANGNWHNYVVVNDAVSNTARLYYDGVLYGTAGYRNASANTKLYIGGSNGGWQWNGAIGNFQVYNRILSPAEIIQNFDNLKTRYGL